jgi:hypothetical protein
MPWLEIGVTALGQAVIKRAGNAAASAAIQVFQEHRASSVRWLFSRTHAEQHLTRSTSELIAFYRNEQPLSVVIGDKIYQSPVSIMVEPAGAGSLAEQPMQFRLLDTPFQIPERIAPYSEPILRKLNSHWWPTNNSKGRIVSLRALERTQTGQWLFKLAEGSYFDALATNVAMDHKPRNRTQSLREAISESSGTLGRFETSPLVNDIGVICLVESADGYLVVQKRSAAVANRPNTLSASVTGGLDWFDVTKGRRKLLLSDMATGVRRETYNELGVESGDLLFLGLAREFLRGGKPEMYFFGRSEKSFLSIKEARLRAPERYETKDIIGLEFHSDRISRNEQSWFAFLNRARDALHAKKANLTLITGILLAIQRFTAERSKSMS